MRSRTNKWVISIGVIFLSLFILSCEKNYPPHITDTTFTRTPGNFTTSFVLTVEASDPNLDPLTFLWEAKQGTFDHPDKNETIWTGPEISTDTEYDITITVSDGKGSVTETISISIVAPKYGNLSGFAYFAKCKIPIHEAIISIAGRRDTTKFDGAFFLDGVKGGRQTLTGEKDGFNTSSRDVLIFEGANEENVNISSSEFTSTMQGKCYGNISQDAKPWLEVIVLNPNNSESELKAQSDGAGYYVLENVPHGARKIVVKDEAGNIKMETQLYIEHDMDFDVPIKEPFVFTDTRDNKQYTAVRIKSQTWMAENLAYMPHVSPQWEQGGIWTYGYSGADPSIAISSDNYQKYGCLYDFHTTTTDHGNGKDICPPGWHVPSDDEWKILEVGIGLKPIELDSVGWRNTNSIGTKLKYDSGWDNEGNGSNSSSFGALPSGFRSLAGNGNFSGLFGFAYFWTADSYDDDMAWRRYLYYNRDGVGRFRDLKNSGLAVRCVKDL